MEGGVVFLILCLLRSYTFTDASFTSIPGNAAGFCEGTNASLTWVFTNLPGVSCVHWKVNGTTNVARLIGTTFIEGTEYSGRLQNDGNGEITIINATLSDSGTYKCDVEYNDGTPPATNETAVTIYSLWTVTLEVTEKQDDKSETTLHSNINDSTVQHTWNSKAGGSSLTVTENGDYTLCISGGRAECLSPASSNCVTYTVKSIDIYPLIVYTILPATLIVLLGTIIVIVVACYTDKDGKLKEGSMKESCECCPSENTFCRVVCPLCTNPLCTDSDEKCCTGLSVTVKNVLSVVVITVVAIIIGVIIAVGLGLNSGECILALVLSIVCGAVLLVIFIVSVYPHWPCVPEKMIANPKTKEDETEKPKDQESKKQSQRRKRRNKKQKHQQTDNKKPLPNQNEENTPGSILPHSASEVRLTQGRTPVEKKEKGTSLPKPNKLPPEQTPLMQTAEKAGNEEGRE